jgi:hypothetical protein
MGGAVSFALLRSLRLGAPGWAPLPCPLRQAGTEEPPQIERIRNIHAPFQAKTAGKAHEYFALLLCTLLFCLPLRAQPLPVFDGHMHYNEEAKQVISPAQVIDLWKRVGIQYVLATSRPNDGSLELIELAKKTAPNITIYPFLRPYIVQPDRYDWFKSAKIQAYVESELKRGIYKGIGEFHIFGADADAPYMKKIALLARERGLWLHAHCDEDALRRILAHAPGVKVLWAHTGMTTALDTVDALFMQHPQIIGELSYRSDLTENDALNPAWKTLLAKYPTRFVVGTDAWINQRWGTTPETIAFYRKVFEQLPKDLAQNLAWKNGVAAMK